MSKNESARESVSTEKLVIEGISFLIGVQKEDGGFESYSSPSSSNFKSERSYRTTFAPALMLAALASSDIVASEPPLRRLAAWLERQSSPAWSFNYWAKGAPQRQTAPYPDDLDDTFCALSALYVWNPAGFGEEKLAAAVKLLLAAETKVGGPYRTWLVSPSTAEVWQDSDLAVNCNIAYFLSLAGNVVPSLVDMSEQALFSGGLTSPYYPSEYPVVYFMARFYKGEHVDLLIEKLRQMEAKAANALEIALCASSLARLGVSCDKNLPARLAELRDSDGSWPAAAFCLDPAVSGQQYYSGSAALTTAFVLEALALTKHQGGRDKLAASNTPARSPIKRMTEGNAKVLRLARQQCRPLGADLRQSTITALEELASSRNGQEIIGLTRRFNKSLPGSKSSDRILTVLSLANLYGWLAYTIYDDFLDEEGRPELLPVANVAMRNSLACFKQALPIDNSFGSLVDEVFNTVDGANSWELAHCRLRREGHYLVISSLPDYGDLSKLAERSLGHALTPLALLASVGVDHRSRASRHLREAFAHYLIARQLNDDCHDWLEDMWRGQASYVVVRLLEDMAISPGRHALHVLAKKARQQFWYRTLPELCDEMRDQLELSRQALAKVDGLKSNNVLDRLLDGIEDSIADTTAKQGSAENFLKHYQQSSVAT